MRFMSGRALLMRGVVLVLVCALHNVHTTWWHLGLLGSQTATPDEQVFADAPKSRCSNVNYLIPKQQKLCEDDERILDVISRGARQGISECQYQFHSRRWNCSTFNETNIFGKVLTIKSRETAYIYSIFSAGIMHSVTKACARGELNKCGCDMKVRKRQPPSDEFEWGGCSDNIRYSNRFSRDFVDTKEQWTKAQALMNLWNNEAGRRAVKSNLQLTCKCHGVSASCTKRICWRSLRPFRQISTMLKMKFDGASKVKLNKRKQKLKRLNRHQKAPTKRDLVYLEESPDFCERNIKSGILGTRRRLCNKTSQGLDGCVLMCCGRGYYTIVKEVIEDCDCKFFWCCKVECKKCKKITEEHHCN